MSSLLLSVGGLMRSVICMTNGDDVVRQVHASIKNECFEKLDSLMSRVVEQKCLTVEDRVELRVLLKRLGLACWMERRSSVSSELGFLIEECLRLDGVQDRKDICGEGIVDDKEL